MAGTGTRSEKGSLVSPSSLLCLARSSLYRTNIKNSSLLTDHIVLWKSGNKIRFFSFSWKKCSYSYSLGAYMYMYTAYGTLCASVWKGGECGCGFFSCMKMTLLRGWSTVHYIHVNDVWGRTLLRKLATAETSISKAIVSWYPLLSNIYTC